MAPAVSCFLGLPKPIWVLQSTITGRSDALAAVSARSMSTGRGRRRKHLPAGGGEARALVGHVRQATLPSMEMSLLSHSTISFDSFCMPARPIASWLMPSIRQPSPAMTQVR
jgi:hypothetical protein